MFFFSKKKMLKKDSKMLFSINARCACLSFLFERSFFMCIIEFFFSPENSLFEDFHCLFQCFIFPPQSPFFGFIFPISLRFAHLFCDRDCSHFLFMSNLSIIICPLCIWSGPIINSLSHIIRLLFFPFLFFHLFRILWKTRTHHFAKYLLMRF